MSFSTRPLGEVARLLSGGTPRKSNPAYWQGPIPWLTPKDMGRWENQTEAHVSEQAIGNGTRLAPANASFVAVRGMSLHNEIRVIRCSRSITFNQDIKAVVAGPDLDDGFLYYALTAAKPSLLNSVSAAGHGTGVLATDRLLALPIPSIPVQTQRAIAKLFGDIDDKIELNRQMNETLEAQARALFRDWFVDFGPVKAKMAGDTPYLAPDLWSHFPNRLDDHGLPEGWHYSPIGAEVDAVGGSTPSTKNAEFWDGDIAWTTPKDLSGLGSPILLETSRKITKAGLTKISSGLLPEGTVLLSSRAPVGYLAITQIPMAVNQGYIAMRCKGRISNYFAFLWAKENIDLILQNANGSTFQEISKKNFRPLPVIVVDEHAHRQFDSMVEPFFEKIVANELESRTLAQTRDLLLPKLMSGEIRVGDVASEELSAA